MAINVCSPSKDILAPQPQIYWSRIMRFWGPGKKILRKWAHIWQHMQFNVWRTCHNSWSTQLYHTCFFNTKVYPRLSNTAECWPLVNYNQLWLFQPLCVLQHLLKVTSIFIVLSKYFTLFYSCLPVKAIRKADVSLSKYLSNVFQLSTFRIQMDSRFHIFLLYKGLKFSFKPQNKESKLVL